MKRFFSLIALVASLVVLTACSSEKGTLVVGLEAEYAPFNWMTPTKTEYTYELDGQPGFYVDGYDVQMAREIANELNLTLIIKAIEWKGLIPALNSNQIDLIIAGMSPTAERLLEINFTTEYYRSEVVMVVHKDSQYVNATSLNDFSGSRAIAQTGTIYDGLIPQIPNVIHQQSLSTYSALMTAVVSRSSDVLVAELPVAQSLVSGNSNLQIVRLQSSFETLDEEVTVAIGMRKTDTELLEDINAVLKNISKETRNEWMEAALLRQE